MGGPSKERQWGETIRQAEQRARETRYTADVAACDTWNFRMEGYGGPAQPSPPIAGCKTHSTVDLTTLRRPRETPIWQLEQRMRCRPCSETRGYPYKRGHLVRLRRTNITTRQEPWYHGDQRDRH